MKRKLLLLSICVGLTVVVGAQSASFTDQWMDKSPHQEKFIRVNGVNLHYLDWGGKGPTLLFLTGKDHSAHIYDTLAPRFTDRFRVLALTRRGHGQSDKPLTGYDTKTLVEDIRQFLEALKIKSVSIVGHSMAATEMTRFAGLYPARVDKLIYLDAAFDYSPEWFAINSSAPPERPPTAEQLASFEKFREFYQQAKCGWSEAWEADMRHTIVYSPEGKPLRAAMPDEVSQAIFKGMMEANSDYAKVKVPALSFVVLGRFPDCSFAANPDAATRQRIRDFNERFVQYRRKQIERFKKEVAQAQVVEVMNDDHYFFLQEKQDAVVGQMRVFLFSQ